VPLPSEVPLQGRLQRRPRPFSRALARNVARSAALAFAGFAAAAIPLHFLLQRELRDAAEDVRALGLPIRLIQVLFTKYVIHWIDVKGLEHLPAGSYVVAANHPYKSGVDGFILGHLLATRARRVPRILVTAESRSWAVSAQRWVLHHYGIALLVPEESIPRTPHARGLSDIIADYLKESPGHAVLIFPAGRATQDPALQLEHWSTGAVVAARKSGCPVVPVAIGGLPPDWRPETLLFSAIEATGPKPPFRIHVRIGEPIVAGSDPHRDLDRLREAVANLMHDLPDLPPAPADS
jgi:1-acyl-sn-glycerol-3-phosphate acyltransferase